MASSGAGVEYASKAVENSGTAIGLRVKDGIVVCSEKLLQSKMLVPGSSRRVNAVDRNAGCAITGFVSDGRQLVNRAREEARNYEETYGIKAPPGVLCDRLAGYTHYFTLHGALRPFGASVIMASYDEDVKDHQLHMIDPSGTVHRYFGCAAGKGRQGAKTEIEKLDLNALTCADAVKEAVKIILMMRDESKDKPCEIEVGILSDGVFKRANDETIKEAEKWAKEQLEEDEDMDEDED